MFPDVRGTTENRLDRSARAGVDKTSCIKHLSDHLGNFVGLLREAGTKVLSVYEEDFKVVLKSDDSPLTLADSESHDLLAGMLPTILPVPVLSEEGRQIPLSERAAWKAFWSIDPLDGTREFVKRSGEFCISVALVLDGVPIFGMIDIPVEDRIYFGGEGFGSYRLQGRRVESLKGRGREEVLSASDKLGADENAAKGKDRPWVLLGSMSHRTVVPDKMMNALEAKETFKRWSVGSAIKFCRIAEGAADFYPRFGRTMEWDTAAGQAIVSGIGGGVVEIKSRKSLRYNKENLENPDFFCYSPRFKKHFPDFFVSSGRD